MKLLFLANRTPYPPYRGDKLKIYHLAKRLAAKGHELHLLTFAQNEEDKSYEPELRKIFTEVHLISLPKWRSALNCVSAAWSRLPIQVIYFQSGAMRRRLRTLLARHQYDAVHVQHLRMAPYLANNKSVPRILDLPDAFSLYWERRKEISGNVFIRLFESIERRRILRYEPVMKKYDLALACSPEDINYLRKKHGINNLHLLPNGVDTDVFKAGNHSYQSSETLLFTGNMDYAPNVDAVLYFVRDIWPIVRQKFPEVRFVIAGQRPVAAVLALANDHIQVTGFVPDIAAVYQSAAVVVAPLRFGAGTQNKVLEAMAMGVPVVCSSVGFAGLGIVSGDGAFMEQSAGAFAARIIDLLSAAALREATGKKGIEAIHSRFSWDIVTAMLYDYFSLAAKIKSESTGIVSS